MKLDNKLENLIIKVSSRAALSSYYLVGKKDKIAADKAAVVNATKLLERHPFFLITGYFIFFPLDRSCLWPT